jgi:preprotein translocase subunit SecA
VAASEQISERLRKAGLKFCVLNAKQNEDEALIIAEAGKLGRITVATNMAGRGTDIKLDPQALDLGGLHVIGTERHDARRIDRQLFGRCGRQGEPGSYALFLSMDDELVSVGLKRQLRHFVKYALNRNLFFSRAISLMAISWTQLKAERLHFQIRRQLLELDKHMEKNLAVAGAGE